MTKGSFLCQTMRSLVELGTSACNSKLSQRLKKLQKMLEEEYGLSFESMEDKLMR